MTITWPASLVPARCNPTLRNFSASGGRTITGREQRVFNDAGFWSIDMQRIVVKDRITRYAYDALLARLRQGEDVVVPIFDLYAGLGAKNIGSEARLSVDHALRATTVNITVSGIDIQPGVRFSLGDRLYLITEIVAGPSSPPLENQLVSDSPWSDEQPWTDVGEATSTFAVKVLPPLRYGALANDLVNFAEPVVRCWPQSINDGDLDLEIGRYGFPSITFIESID